MSSSWLSVNETKCHCQSHAPSLCFCLYRHAYTCIYHIHTTTHTHTYMHPPFSKLGAGLHQCVLRNKLAGSKNVVSMSQDAPAWQIESKLVYDSNFKLNQERRLAVSEMCLQRSLSRYYSRRGMPRSQRKGMGKLWHAIVCWRDEFRAVWRWTGKREIASIPRAKTTYFAFF